MTRNAFLKQTILTGLALGPHARAQAKARRVIIDTDPGTDDALALFLALRSPELIVEAMTPVAGNVPLDLTLPNALRLLEIAGRTDIPVAAGASHPLKRKLITAAYAHGENGLGGVEFPAPKIKPVDGTAAQLIRRMVRQSPGEIHLIAIGPLTNLALAFEQDPGLPKLIPSLTIMGGSLSGGNITPAAEFNIYVDPEAAQAVFHAGIPLTMVGLDVTRKALLTERHIEELEAAPNPVSQAAGRITRAIHHRMRNASGQAMHDSLALAAFLDPSLVTLRDMHVEVETRGEFTAGETLGYQGARIRRSAPMVDAPSPAGETEFHTNAKVAVDVDADRFLKLLVGRLTT
ncbi:MAG TPA: nucleoside hydrolase [Bryobacteraceae bacterium]|nr:nucleoside hydrolase [Bryobacteraceae bacterium]